MSQAFNLQLAKSVISVISPREEFANKYVEYFIEMNHVSKITTLNNYFFQLILFLHEGGEKFDTTLSTHKIKENCFFIDKVFENTVQFYGHGDESQMYIKYICEYCPEEIKKEIIFGNSNPQTFYGCDFQCPLTFELISEKLKKLGFTKAELIEQQNEIAKLKDENSEEYEKKLNEYKKNVTRVRNICTFRQAVKNI